MKIHQDDQLVRGLRAGRQSSGSAILAVVQNVPKLYQRGMFQVP